jgi:hypothetical protein
MEETRSAGLLLREGEAVVGSPAGSARFGAADVRLEGRGLQLIGAPTIELVGKVVVRGELAVTSVADETPVDTLRHLVEHLRERS